MNTSQLAENRIKLMHSKDFNKGNPFKMFDKSVPIHSKTL
jgi:hypothetical protein